MTVTESRWVAPTWTNAPAKISTQEIVEEREGYWTVRDPQTGIFGSGPDRDAAFDDFGHALHEHYDVLARQDALSEELTLQLAYLRQRLA